MRTKEEIANAFDPTDSLNRDSRFFLIGIGGAGMSSLAIMLQNRGCYVAGSDATRSHVTDQLIERGIPVLIGHDPNAVSQGDQLIISDAIDLHSNAQVLRSLELGNPIFRRSQLLGWLLRDKKVIAVTGTHGKTTTTSMIALALKAAGLNPTIIVGAVVPELKTSIVEGEGDYAVVEACEAYDSFHDLTPEHIVLTNLELDHVDFHGTYENLRDSVLRFVNSIPSNGKLWFCPDDRGACEIASLSSVKSEPYSSSSQHLELKGEKNRWNAGAAEQVVCELISGVPERAAALAAIRNFRGADRRLQVKLEGAITVVDDYAHHPTEIRSSIQALREMYPGRRLVVVYQPHLYSRTKEMLPQFADALNLADFVVLTDIYPAREDPIPGMSSSRIAEQLTVSHEYVPARQLLPRHIKRRIKEGDVVVGMGAGTIEYFAPAFVKLLSENRVQDFLAGKPSALKTLVVYGGDSPEREVSIHSGNAVAESLSRLGHEVRKVDISEVLLSSCDLRFLSGDARPDVVFLSVHGSHAEDGAIQGLFELLHIPYTGSSIQASALAMDKQLTKKLLAEAGLPVPQGQLITSPEQDIHIKAPCVVKPNAQGSTVGLSFVQHDEDVDAAVRRAMPFEGGVLIETWLRGMEISCPVLGDRALPPVEIAPVSGMYDFASKYTPGATEEIVPARLPEPLLQKAMSQALTAHRALGCSGATRTDMIVVDEELVILEVNTLPGMTPTSLLPNSAQSVGIAFDQLVEWIIKDALIRHA